MTWDTSADDLILNGGAGLIVPDGQLTLGSVAIAATATEINTAADGNTSIGTTTVSDGHGIVMNHGGTMAQTTVQTLSAYLDDEITAMPNLTSVGTLTTLTIDNIIINGTNIGHTSDTDAIAIASDGVVTMNQIPVFSAGINVSGGSIAGTLSTAAQTNITSLGTLTALQVDYANLNASTLKITDSSDTGDYASLEVTTHGATTLTTVDDDDAAAHLVFDVDGNITLDADAGTITFSDAGSSLGTITSSGYSGNAATATALATARAINGVNFDGTAAITVTAAGSTLSDTVPVSKGGTNATSLADKAVLITQDSGTDTVAAAAMSTNGQLLIGGTSGPAVATLTAGTGISISNSDGGVTVTNTVSDTNTTYTAGTLLDLSSTTFNVDLSEASAATMAAADEFIILDNDDSSAAKRESLQDVLDTVAGTVATTGLDRSGATLVVSDLHPVGVDGSANQLLTDDGDGTVTSESGLSFTGTALSLTGNIVASGTSDHQGLIVTAANSAADDALGNQKGIGVIATMRAKTGIAIGELLHIDGDGDLDEAHADATADMPAIAIALEANSSGSDANIKVLLQGFYRDDSQFSFGTVGAPVYADHSTEGDFTLTASSTDGHFIQRVGISATDDMIYFNPSLDVIEHA